MKKLIFKLSKIQHVFFTLLVAGALTSCDKEDVPTQEPEFTQEELAEMAAADKFAAANSVYRALALIDELPDNWESATYTPAEGVPVDEANSDIRNVVSTGVEQAKGYFLSIVPDLGLEGDIWSHEGVGTLTFKAVNEDNCYAVIDVDLVQMPGLKQLRFVPESVVGENKWEGATYYEVGDVIKDKKTGAYWICVRPAGGPLKKDYAYFVSFDKRLIKTKEQKQDIYEVTGTGEDAKVGKTKVAANSGKWVYAKNLVEERIAYAAAHVFAYLADAKMFNDLGLPGASMFYSKALNNAGSFDTANLTLNVGKRVFHIAYGSYQSSGSKKCTQAKYIQPIFSFALEPYENNTKTLQRVTKAWTQPGTINTPSKHLMSLTAGHDPLTYAYFGEAYKGYDSPFSILDYTIDFMPMENPQFSHLSNLVEPMLFMPTWNNERLPLVMTQMSLTDHGKPVSGYLNVVNDMLGEIEPDYWMSIENSYRVVFESGKEKDIEPVTE